MVHPTSSTLTWPQVQRMSLVDLGQLGGRALDHLLAVESESDAATDRAASPGSPSTAAGDGLPTLPRLARVTDESYHDLGFALLRGPLDAAQRERLERLKGRYRILGMSSHRAFPTVDGEGHPDYVALAEGWCHCFRDPDRYLPASRPRVMLPESDFTDYTCINRRNLRLPAGDKAFDFIYVCTDSGARNDSKNWTLARECIPILCRDLGLRGLVVGRANIPDVPDCENLTVLGPVPWLVLLLLLHRSRLIFVPSVFDASPRVLAEAMCLDVPLLVNRHILGGWHYVNDATGTFFDSTADVAAGALHCLRAPLTPRRWYVRHHGWFRAGKRLYDFLKHLDPQLRPAQGAFILNDLK